MRKILNWVKSSLRGSDMVLLFMCIFASAFGCLIVASTNNYRGYSHYVNVQLLAIGIGMIAYLVMSALNLDLLSEYRTVLVLFNAGLLLLLIPFGIDNNTGNRSWLHFPFLPVDIQPAEICKILYIIITASVMASHQNRASHPLSVCHILLHLALIVGLNFFISRDLGVTLIFVFIFVGMFISGGIKLIWVGIGAAALSVIGPLFWNYGMTDEQRNRIAYVFNPEAIDPQGLDEGWHTTQSLKSLTGGGLTGQGLFQGARTQAGSLNAQHTDFIFSAIGEELGFLGCFLVVVFLALIVFRCIWVGVRSKDYMRRLVCFGAASSLMFQIILNVGMCIGVTPVIGLTLPLISYGGSSIVTTYAMLGLVSGVHARPAPRSYERYIRLPPRL